MSSRHDIVHGLTIAKGHAELYSEKHPEHAGAATTLIKRIDRIRQEFISATRSKKRSPS